MRNLILRKKFILFFRKKESILILLPRLSVKSIDFLPSMISIFSKNRKLSISQFISWLSFRMLKQNRNFMGKLLMLLRSFRKEMKIVNVPLTLLRYKKSRNYLLRKFYHIIPCTRLFLIIILIFSFRLSYLQLLKVLMKNHFQVEQRLKLKILKY